MSKLINAGCVILCGGKGRRMGGVDKASIRFEGQTLLSRQLAKAKPLFAKVAVAPGPNSVSEYAFASADDEYDVVKVLQDEPEVEGPMAGLLAALNWCDLPYLFAIAVDMPSWESDLVRLLFGRCPLGESDTLKAAYVIPRSNGRLQPLCGFYPVGSRTEMLAYCAGGNFSLSRFLTENTAIPKIIVESDDLEAELDGAAASHFTNWNEPGDIGGH